MKIDIDKIRRSVGMIGESTHTIEILNLIGQVANTDISVLVSGESGSGKDVIAVLVFNHGSGPVKVPMVNFFVPRNIALSIELDDQNIINITWGWPCPANGPSYNHIPPVGGFDHLAGPVLVILA